MEREHRLRDATSIRYRDETLQSGELGSAKPVTPRRNSPVRVTCWFPATSMVRRGVKPLKHSLPYPINPTPQFKLGQGELLHHHTPSFAAHLSSLYHMQASYLALLYVV